jgi:hypothetical protein
MCAELLPRFLPCVSSSANKQLTALPIVAQNHSIQQQTASLLTTYCMLLSQGVMGQHCLRHCLRIEKETVGHGMLYVHGQSLPSAGSLLFVAGCFPLLLFADTC